MNWIEFKDYLSQATDLHQDALHIYAAFLIQFGSALILRRSLGSFLPWFLVLAALVVNEAIDLSEPGRPIEQWQVIGGIQDSWNTMVLPTALWLLARYAPWMMATGSSSAPSLLRHPPHKS